MALGIDFGTTRTIVAVADRGNYPVIDFYDAADDPHDYFPSVAADREGQLVFGWDAEAAAAEHKPVLRSFKRLLADADARPDTRLRVGSIEVSLLELLTQFCRALMTALRTRSTLPNQSPGAPEVAIAVPAHARSAQRFLTLEAFRTAGFVVRAMLNEPSAAGFEYTHRQPRSITSRRTRVIVYDLGGGTFDASAVRVEGTHHLVEDTAGINRLGGDDFDLALAQLAATRAGTDFDQLDALAQDTLIDEARDCKERISPQTKRLVLEVAGEPVTLAVDDFYWAASPLVDATMDAMDHLVASFDSPDSSDIAGIYLVGGASQLPLVARTLRGRFGRRVHRSPLPAASAAIGLAIAVDPMADYSLRDQLSRGFGVFRELNAGRETSFDPIFDRSAVPGAGTLIRRYRAAHTVGWFRFVEYSSLGAGGEPQGDIVPLAEVRFPFVGDLTRSELARWPVEPLDTAPLVEERYTVDDSGLVQVEIVNLDGGYRRRFTLS